MVMLNDIPLKQCCCLGLNGYAKCIDIGNSLNVQWGGRKYGRCAAVTTSAEDYFKCFILV